MCPRQFVDLSDEEVTNHLVKKLNVSEFIKDKRD